MTYCVNDTNKAEYWYKDVQYCFPCFVALVHRNDTMIEFKRRRNLKGEIINERKD